MVTFALLNWMYIVILNISLIVAKNLPNYKMVLAALNMHSEI